MKKNIFSLVTLCVCFIHGYGQNIESLLPFSAQYKLLPVVDFVNMPDFDYSKMIAEDKVNRDRGEKRYRFAKKINTDIVPYNEGLWEETPNGGRVWRIGIRSIKAHSLYVVLRNFEIKAGVRVFAYNSSQTDWHGPFTASENNARKVLVIPPVRGNEIIVELNIDAGIEHFGEFTIQEVWHDYRNILSNSRIKSELYNSGSCNVDINCPDGSSWQTEKRAVCRFIANGEYCTGTLINNVPGEKIPYLITAQHCIEDADIAATSIYYFEYESPTCKGTTTSNPKVVSGAELKATTPNQLDFSLVRLSRFPAITDGLYLAGWDANFEAPNNGVCIHHPSGDVKKISITNSSLYTANFGEGYNTNSHWLVSKWDVGTTEGGSSGSSLFNSQHRIIGTLSGGDAVCGNSVNDYYTKFALDWDFYADSSKQLKYWLDPQNSGVRSIPGAAPYGLYQPECDTLINISNNEELIYSETGSWGYLSGHNSYGDTEFAEKFTVSNPITLPGIIITPAIALGGSSFANVTFKIWGGTDIPAQVIYSKVYFMKYLEAGIQNFVEFDSLVHLSGTFFIGYSLNYSSPEDVFALYHSANRQSGLSTMYVARNNVWANCKDITSPAYYTSLAVSFTSCEPLENNLPDEMKLYPNPASGVIFVDLPVSGEVSDVDCFNVIGKRQNIEWEVDASANRLAVKIHSLRSGVYGLRFSLAGKQYTKQFVVIPSR